MSLIRCTAWDCLSEYSELIDDTHLIRLVGGRTLYEGAFYVAGHKRDKVKLARLELGEWVRQVNRYVEPDTPVELVPIGDS